MQDNNKKQEYVDITEPDHGVQVTMRGDIDSGYVLWVNVDGLCVARICRIPYLEFNIMDHELILFGEASAQD